MNSYWGKDIRLSFVSFQSMSSTQRLLYASVSVAIATMLQSTGVIVPVFSALATAPIILCILFIPGYGFISYFVVCLLLLLLQPSELIVFAFTTGLLGLAIGYAYVLFKIRIIIVSIGACALTSGIELLLFLFHFPILGPLSSQQDHIFPFLILFSFIYSWIWTEAIRGIIQKLFSAQ
jgi:hypothetical protein